MRLGALGAYSSISRSISKPLSRRHVDELAVREMELDLTRVRPLDAVQAALWPLQALGHAVQVHGEQRDRRVAEKDEPPAGPQQARRLGIQR